MEMVRWMTVVEEALPLVWLLCGIAVGCIRRVALGLRGCNQGNRYRKRG